MTAPIQMKYAHLVPDVWAELGRIERTGWVMREVKDPETVQGHTIALRRLAYSLAPELPDFAAEDIEDLADMLEIHDWSEAIDGDEVILTFDEDEKKRLLASKFEREKKTMEIICAPLGEDGDKIMALWMRFETSDDKVASLAKQLDKYQAIEQAMEYEKAQGIPLFREFHDYSIMHITHPVLLRRLEEMKAAQ